MTVYNIEKITNKIPGHDKIIAHMIWAMIIQGRDGTCDKSKRVSSIYSPSRQTYVIATNSPPAPFTCTKDDDCRKNCSKLAVHAEERAIIKAAKSNLLPENNLHCFHLKIQHNVPVPSKEPSCVYCSRKMLEFGINYMWLYVDSGWKSWKMENFHRESLINTGLIKNDKNRK